MALVKCKECNKEISSTAKQCPSCGYKIKKVGLFWPIIIGLMLIGYFFGDQEKSSKEVKVNNVKKLIKQEEITCKNNTGIQDM